MTGKTKLYIGLLVPGIILFVSVILLQPGCSKSSPPYSSGYAAGLIFVDYINSYDDIGELAADADIIAAGTIDRTLDVLPANPAEAIEDPRQRTYITRSTFSVEKVIKGDVRGEIIVSQMGATGRAEERGNPVFMPGEKCLLFLREGSDGMYYLVHPVGRFTIKDGNVYSMNYILPTGESRPPQDLKFWKIDLDTFTERVAVELDNVRLDFTDDLGVRADVRRLPAGFSLNINVNLYTGRLGQGDVHYTVNLVDCQDGKGTLPLPDEMTLDIKPDNFTAEPGNTYLSKLEVGATPYLHPGSYCIAVGYNIGDSIESQRIFTLNVDPPEYNGAERKER